MRKRFFAMLLAVLVLCGGCGREDPYRVNTVVRIPVDPTDAATAAPTEAIEETAEETETAPETTEITETTEPVEGPKATEAPKKNNTTPNKKPSSNKGNAGSGGSKPRETEPPAAEPKPTDSPTTEPPATDAPVTEPPETEPENTLYDISGYSVGSLCYGIRDEINALRTEAGQPELSLDSYLSAIASCRGYELSQVWSHTRPDGRGYYTVLGDYGYGAGSVTELLVYVSGSGDAASMVSKWAGSDSHRESLLSKSYTTIGVGTYQANGYTYVCVLLAG